MIRPLRSSNSVSSDERQADAHDDAAAELAGRGLRIEDAPDVERSEEAPHPHLAGYRVDGDLANCAPVRMHGVFHHAPSASTRLPRASTLSRFGAREDRGVALAPRRILGMRQSTVARHDLIWS